MEEFIKKWGGQGSEPYQAVEMIANKVHKIKQKVEQGDSNIIPQLQELSVILDEFAHYAKKGGFQPRQGGNFQGQPYQDYPGQGQQGQQNYYDPYKTVGRVGYGVDNHHWYPNYPQIYPIYPFYNDRDRPGKDVGDRIGYRPDNDDYSRLRESQSDYWDDRDIYPRNDYDIDRDYVPGRDGRDRDGRNYNPNTNPNYNPKRK